MASQGEAVGLLTVPAESVPQIQGIASILGPILVQRHRQDIASKDLFHAKEQITHLLSAGDLLRHLEVDTLLVKILETVLTAVGAQVGAVVVPDERGTLVPRVTWGLRNDHLDAMLLKNGTTIAAATLADGQIRCLDEADLADQLDLSGLTARLTGLLVLPLTSRDAVRGVVVLGNPAEAFTPATSRLAETVCALAAIALDNALLVHAMVESERLKQEMELARGVQAGLFPAKGMDTPLLRVEGASRSCSETGGDYYTFGDRGRDVLLMIGDVSGHGLGAALFTFMAHVLGKRLFRASIDLDHIFRLLNEELSDYQSGRFMTAALVSIDPRTRAFTYVSAGHNPLLWIHEGKAVWLESCGFPLGIMPEGEWPPASEQILSPGDLLILYTDGFSEAANPQGEIYTEERLATIAIEAWRTGMTPTEILVAYNAEADAFTAGAPHTDDLTMVIAQIKPE
jgi:serine phosphatase RsbU (regulator of sigma subunit)